MPTFLRKLFERYARRLIIGTEEGITQIPNKDRVKLMADNIYKDFKAVGIPDKMIKTEKDIKVFHNQISAIEEKSSKKWWDKRLQKPPESADVVQFPEEAITDWTKPRPTPDKNFIPMRADQYRDVFGKSPDLKITESQIKSKLEGLNKKTIERIKRKRYEKALKEERIKSAKDEFHIPDIIDPDDFLAEGGIAGLLGEPTYADGGRVPLRFGKGPLAPKSGPLDWWDLIGDEMDPDEWEDILKSVGAYQDGAVFR